jgi:chromate transporter
MTIATSIAETQQERVSLTRAGYFLRLGTIGFGGPIALAGHVQQDLVDDRRWVRKEEYLEGLALAQLAPGPLAAQPAIYLGYIHSGNLWCDSDCHRLHPAIVFDGCSSSRLRTSGLADFHGMQGMFYGIGAAVIGIIARSAFKLAKLTLAKDKVLWAIFFVLGISTAWTSREIIWLFFLSGFVAMLVKAMPTRLPVRSTASSLLVPGTISLAGKGEHYCKYSSTSPRPDCSSSVAVLPSYPFYMAEWSRATIGLMSINS